MYREDTHTNIYIWRIWRQIENIKTANTIISELRGNMIEVYK